jgi:hypothetical protein
MAGPLPHARTCLPNAAMMLSLALLVALPARAQAPADGPPSDNALLTLEGQAALRDRLWARVLTLGSRAAAGEMEDPELVPWRHGQAVRVDRGKGAEVLTAALLVDGAAQVRVARGEDEAAARGAGSDERTLLATLSCGGPCEALPRLEAAPVASWEAGGVLHFVLPSTPGVPVLGDALSLGLQADPFDALVAVTGKAPPGTVLFDAAGLPAAVVVRNHPMRDDRMLAAPLRLPPPAAPVDEDDGGAGKGIRPDEGAGTGTGAGKGNGGGAAPGGAR